MRSSEGREGGGSSRNARWWQRHEGSPLLPSFSRARVHGRTTGSYGEGDGPTSCRVQEDGEEGGEEEEGRPERLRRWLGATRLLGH